MSDTDPTLSPSEPQPPETPEAAPEPATRATLVQPIRRGLLWGVLLAAIVVVGLIALRGTRTRTAPPPVLGTALTEAVPDFQLTNRDGRTVYLSELAGNPWVADLVFTRCVLACPRMTERMKRLDAELPETVKLVSISVDPEHDTPERLAEYAAKHGASDRWLFLTGDPEVIRRTAIDGFKLGVGRDDEATEPGMAITHSDRFVLVDERLRVRGYYDPFDADGLPRLGRELRALEESG